MKQTELILFVILIQASGSAGALLFGRITDKRSGKEAIIFSLLILIASVSGLFIIDRLLWFYVVGIFSGFSLSGAQAVRRTVVSQLAPTTETNGVLRVSFRCRAHLYFYRTDRLFCGTFVPRQQLYVNHG